MTLNITINNELLLYMYLSLNWLKGHNLMDIKIFSLIWVKKQMELLLES